MSEGGGGMDGGGGDPRPEGGRSPGGGLGSRDGNEPETATAEGPSPRTETSAFALAMGVTAVAAAGWLAFSAAPHFYGRYYRLTEGLLLLAAVAAAVTVLGALLGARTRKRRLAASADADDADRPV